MVVSDPALGPIYVLKDNISNGFYCIDLQHGYVPKLGLFPPSSVNREYLVAIPLTLPIIWNKSQLILCTTMDTFSDLSNAALLCNLTSLPHKMDSHEKLVAIENLHPHQTKLNNLIRDPYFQRRNSKPTSYADVFVDDFC